MLFFWGTFLDIFLKKSDTFTTFCLHVRKSSYLGAALTTYAMVLASPATTVVKFNI
jgi:hypothetical protein